MYLVVKYWFQAFILFILLSHGSLSQNNASSWGYQLQNFSIDELKNSEYDLLVIDYSFDGSDEEALTSTQVNEIQNNSKQVISYISIGEAEDYRFYFDNDWLTNSPEWFDGENPDWEGNYKVKFWYDEWKSIVFTYIDKIINAEFNGLYLDIIDAFEFYQDDFPNADELMMDLVIEIANYGKTNSVFGSDFMIIPQNGEPLLNNATYLEAVDGIGREDVYIIEDGEDKRPSDEISEIEQDLDLLINSNKLVLTVDYSSNRELIEFARNSAINKGYLHYIGTLELDKLLDVNYSGTIEEGNLSSYQYILFSFLILIVIKKHRRLI